MNDLVAIGKIAQWHKLKMPVLDSVPSPIMKRVYNMKDQKVQTRPATQPTALVHEVYVRLPAQ